MVLFPNAKINIGLFVTEKRTDGFHNLESIFYPIKWHDVLEFVPSEKFIFESSGIAVAGEIESNLVIQAYRLLQEAYSLPNIHIHLHKNIPMGAGLGGGSADAAFMLKGLNDFFDLKLDNDSLENFARKLAVYFPRRVMLNVVF